MRVIGVMSGKGGVGKTTTVANLGVAFSEVGHSTLAIDANLAFPNLALHFGLIDVHADLQNILSTKLDVDDVAIRYGDSRLKILPTSLRYKNVSYKNMAKVVQNVKGYEYVLLDCAPGGYLAPMEAFLRSCTEVLLITTPDFPAVSAVAKTAKLAKQLKIRILGVVINRVQQKNFELTKQDIEKICGVPVICMIPEDSAVPESISARVPVVLNSPSSAAAKKYRQLVHLLAADGSVLDESIMDKLVSWFKRLF